MVIRILVAVFRLEKCLATYAIVTLFVKQTLVTGTVLGFNAIGSRSSQWAADRGSPRFRIVDTMRSIGVANAIICGVTSNTDHVEIRVNRRTTTRLTVRRVKASVPKFSRWSACICSRRYLET